MVHFMNVKHRPREFFAVEPPLLEPAEDVLVVSYLWLTRIISPYPWKQHEIPHAKALVIFIFE
jgi:hypothetical protein